MFSQGKYQEALDYFDQALEIAEILKDPVIQLKVHIYLILTHLRIDDPGKAASYLPKMEEITLSTGSRKSMVKHRLAKALVLRKKPRVKDKIQAQQEFEELVNEDILEWSFKKIARMNLIEMLIEEYKNYQEEEVYRELKGLLDSYQQLANQESAISDMIKSSIIKARLTFIEGDMDGSLAMLEGAKDLSMSYQLHSFVSLITKETEKMENQIEYWSKMKAADDIENSKNKYLEYIIQVTKSLKRCHKTYS